MWTYRRRDEVGSLLAANARELDVNNYEQSCLQVLNLLYSKKNDSFLSERVVSSL